MPSLHPYWIVQLFSTIPHHLIFKYLNPKPVVFASNQGIANQSADWFAMTCFFGAWVQKSCPA